MYANTLREAFGKVYKEVENMYHTLTDEYEIIESNLTRNEKQWTEEKLVMGQEIINLRNTIQDLKNQIVELKQNAKDDDIAYDELFEDREQANQLNIEVLQELKEAKNEIESRKRFMSECGLEDHYQSKRQEPIFPGYGQTNSISEQAIIDLEAEETEEDGISEIPRDPERNVLEGIFW